LGAREPSIHFSFIVAPIRKLPDLTAVNAMTTHYYVARYINSKNKEGGFLIPIRELLNLGISDGTTKVKALDFPKAVAK
jgi:hypothetical protein